MTGPDHSPPGAAPFPVQPVFAHAMDHHLAGRLQEAEALYRRILQDEPNHADALHMFGVLAHQLGHHEVAVACLDRVIAFRPGFVEAHYNRGNALKSLGQKEQAAKSYRQVVRLGGDVPEALFFVGNGFWELGHRAEALACYRRAVGINPRFAAAFAALGRALKEEGAWVEARQACLDALALSPEDPEVWFTLGLIDIQTRSFPEAEEHLKKCLSLRPEFPEALCNLGLVFLESNRVSEAIGFLQEAIALKPDDSAALSNLGAACQEQGRYEEAIDLYSRALAFKPDVAEIFSNMGYALQELGRLDEAVASLMRAVALSPDDPAAWNNLGNVYKQLGRHDEALAAYQRALRIAPDHPEVHANVGALHLELGRWDEALHWFGRVLEIKPDHPEGHLGLGLYHLTMGDLESGWNDYEWRWRTRNFIHHGHSQPLWMGEPLPGKTLLIHCEQGYGDGIQFIRLVPEARRISGAKGVVLFCPEPLSRLFATMAGIDVRTSRREDLPQCDVQVPLLSLPHRLKTTLATIPAPIPYLAADPALVRVFRDRLALYPGFKVGIAWRGNPRHKNDRQRSMDPALFLPLAALPGCCLVNLQMDVTPTERALFAPCHPFVDVSGMVRDFADTAAVLANLDLVIAVDTAVIHLAGAMGRRAWLLLPHVADWRWLRDRSDSPWYPGLRLLRQGTMGDWRACIDRVADDLKKIDQGVPS
ncbi:MAG: tetratricopeptide repeat protein [Magnetococcales bacterium]|nr:tetratricopeptide repeat protein [Magnetococcales bacterium]